MEAAPARWCAELARADADTLAAAFRDVADRMRPRTPDLLKIGHRRERAPAEGGERWFLHVGVVFEGEAGEQFVEATHGSLAREIQRVAELWTGAWATIHRHARGDAALRGYHRPPEGFVLPPPPARSATAPVTSKSTSPERSKPPAPTPPPAPAPPTAPSTQRSLFG